ncbi:hypothetical protein V8C86DRAFT_312002 [Haematococcus lacustris]
MASKKALLLDDDGDEAHPPALAVNTSYAKRFEHNKKREELHRLQAKHPELARKLEQQALRAGGRVAGAEGDTSEDSSSDEEEDDGAIPESTEAKIFETLLRIRSKDPAIYDPATRFFEPEDEGEGKAQEAGGAGGSQQKGSKPLYLKDVLAKQALEGAGLESGEEEEEEEGVRGRVGESRPARAYDQEQEALRRSFLSIAQEAVEGEAPEDAGFGGVLRPRAKAMAAGKQEQEEGEEEGGGGPAAAGGGKGSGKGRKAAPLKKLVDAYFSGQAGPPGAAAGGPVVDPEADRFLRDYILGRGWVDVEEGGAVPAYEEVVGDDDEDEEYLQQADRFEAAYNFRFEEPGSAAVVSHPRNVEGTVRRPDERRKNARQARKERQAQAAAEQAEEVKRLKNLKKEEIEQRLRLIAKVAGAKDAVPDGLDADATAEPAAGGRPGARKSGKKDKRGALRLDPRLLEGEFDPEAWDRQMAEAFGDDYYADEDEELEDLFGEAAQKEEGTEGVQGLSAGAKSGQPSKSEAAAAAARAELSRLLSEYYRLDYEGMAGGIKTRFKYKEVPASSFGLNVDEILAHDDKELNQVAGLKRLAPYREDGRPTGIKERPNYKALQALRAAGPEEVGGRQSGKNRSPAPNRRSGSESHAAGAAASQRGNGKHDRHKMARQQLHPPASHQAPHSASPQAAHTEPTANGKEAKQHGRQHAIDPEAARKASYAKLSLHKPGGKHVADASDKKRKAESAEPRGASGGDGTVSASKKAKHFPESEVGTSVELPSTKAAKKNWKRAQKRQAARAGSGS